jgi:arylsulfatase A-like enzyme
MTKKRIFYLIGFVIGLSVVLYFYFHMKVFSSAPGKYNVVMIVSDALRLDVLGCYGGEARTPNIDWLARNGMLFKNAYSTAPVTMPSAVSMFTGNYSRAYGIQKKKKKNRMAQEFFFYVNNKETLAAETLRDTGYDVCMDVENPLAQRSNNLQGFKSLRSSQELNLREKELVLNTLNLKELPGSHSRMYDYLHYLLTVPEGKRFFLLKWIFDPHGPYKPLKKFRDRITFDTSKLPRKKNEYLYIGDLGFHKLKDIERQYMKELYKAEVEALDERVGFIIKVLRKRKFLRNTIILFTSDHGELFGEHGRMGHAMSYLQHLVNVPLIIMAPHLPKNKTIDTVVSHLDLMPTLMDVLGVKIKNNAMGKSYASLLQGETIDHRWPYFDRISNPMKKKFKLRNSDALIFDWYKLVADKWQGKNEFQLYNLKKDPMEMKDVSAIERKVLRKLLRKIIRMRKKNHARLVKNLRGLDKNVDINSEFQKTQEKLKSLGYIQ